MDPGSQIMLPLPRCSHLFFALLSCAAISAQAPGSLDPTFNPTDVGHGKWDGLSTGNGINDAQLYCAVPMVDGRMVLGGIFYWDDATSRRVITRILPDGALDTTFVPASINGGWVNALAVRPDNKVFAAGNFDLVGGVAHGGLLLFNEDGTIDPGFNIGTGFSTGTTINADVNELVLQPDGKLICSGNWLTLDGDTVPRVVRLMPDGQLDPTFNVGSASNGNINDMRLQPDGRLLCAGGFTTFNGIPHNGIARLNADGSLDTGFAPAITGGSQSDGMDLRADGKIWLQGNFTIVNGVLRQNYVLLTSTGATDPSFVPEASGQHFVNSIAGQANGGLLVGCHLNSPNGEPVQALFRFGPTGALDPVFAGTDFNGSIEQLQVLPDERIVVCGSFTAYGDQGESIFTRLLPDGSVDPELHPSSAFDLYASSILRQPDGKFICTGGFLSYFDRTAKYVTRIFPDGEVDTTFNAWWGLDRVVLDAALQPDGKLLIAGHFINASDTTYSSRLMRLMPDGSRDTTFLQNSIVLPFFRIALQADGKVLAASNAHMYRFMPNGDLDTTFAAGTGNGVTYDMLLQPNGKVLVAGGNTTWNGSPVGPIFRLNTNGTVDNTFSTGSGMDNGYVTDIDRQPDGKILVAGYFTSYDGHPAYRIVRIGVNGAYDASFSTGSGFDNTTYLVTYAPSGDVYVSGNFLNAEGSPRVRFARLNSDGTLDGGFDPGSGPSTSVSDLVFDPQEDLYVVGGFTSYDGVGRNRVAKVFGGTSTLIADQPELPALVIAPNPSQGGFVVDAGAMWNASGDPWLDVVDNAGRIVHHEAWRTARQEIAISVAPGEYFVILRDADRRIALSPLVIR